MAVPLRAPHQRPAARTRRTAVVCGLALLLGGVAGASTLVRDGLPVVSTADLDRIQDAVRDGCDRPGEPLDQGTGFALDGTVEGVSARTVDGPIRLVLEVQEWFVGPPVDRVEVHVDRATARRVTARGGEVEPGARLLVSGPGWDAEGRALTAAGCGRTRAWDQETADAWRSGLPAAARVGPDGPLARYASPGFVWTRPHGSPALRGVLVRDAGCLYVQDGLTRWLPVFPAGVIRWGEGRDRLLLHEEPLDVAHQVRLGGLPATGLVPDGAGRPAVGGDRPRLLDEAGVPSGCDPQARRFVVAGPPAISTARVTTLPADDPLLLALGRALREAGMPPGEPSGEIVRSGYGDVTARLEVTTPDGRVVVRVENVSPLAWPSAYFTSGTRFRSSLDPRHAPGLPPVPRGWQLVVLERDDATQVLLRTPGRIVVSASTEGPADRSAIADLVAIERAVALGRVDERR